MTILIILYYYQCKFCFLNSLSFISFPLFAVVVKALPCTPALDEESILFLENRSCLGLVSILCHFFLSHIIYKDMDT